MERLQPQKVPNNWIIKPRYLNTGIIFIVLLISLKTDPFIFTTNRDLKALVLKPGIQGIILKHIKMKENLHTPIYLSLISVLSI